MDMTDPFAAGPTVRPDLVVIGAPKEAPPTGRGVHAAATPIDGEEVTRHDPSGLFGQERPPGRGRPPWRGVQPVTMQHGPDGSGGDLDTETLEFALSRW